MPGFSLLQSNHRQVSPAASAPTLAYPGNVTAGSLLFSVINYDAGGATGVTMSGGATWSQIGTTQLESVNNQNCGIYMGVNATGGATTVTATATGGSSQVQGAAWVIEEWSGVVTASPLRASDTTASFATTTTVTSNSITVVVGDLILAAFQDSDADTGIAAGSGYSLGGTEAGTLGTTGSCASESATAASTSVNATYTKAGAGHTTIQIAAFKALAAPLVVEHSKFSAIPFQAQGRNL